MKEFDIGARVYAAPTPDFTFKGLIVGVHGFGEAKTYDVQGQNQEIYTNLSGAQVRSGAPVDHGLGDGNVGKSDRTA